MKLLSLVMVFHRIQWASNCPWMPMFVWDKWASIIFKGLASCTVLYVRNDLLFMTPQSLIFNKLSSRMWATWSSLVLQATQLLVLTIWLSQLRWSMLSVLCRLALLSPMQITYMSIPVSVQTILSSLWIFHWDQVYCSVLQINILTRLSCTFTLGGTEIW